MTQPHPSPQERARTISEDIWARTGTRYDPRLVLDVMEGRRNHPGLMRLVGAVLGEKPKEAQGGP